MKDDRNTQSALEKAQTRFLFTCIGSILYIAPCLACLFLLSGGEGFTPALILGAAGSVLSLPAGLLGFRLFKKKGSRVPLFLYDGALCVLLAAAIALLGSNGLITAPHLILVILMMIWSGAAVKK